MTEEVTKSLPPRLRAGLAVELLLVSGWRRARALDTVNVAVDLEPTEDAKILLRGLRHATVHARTLIVRKAALGDAVGNWRPIQE